MPISAAKKSIARSIANAASGRPGAAVRGDRHLVGGHRHAVERAVGDVVHAGRHALRHHRQVGAHQRVRARVLHDVEVVRGDATVAGAADLHVDPLAAALRHRLHRLGARLGVAHRHADLLRQPAERQLLADRARLHAEAAADIRHDRTHAIGGQVVELGEDVAGRVRALARRVVHQPVARRVGLPVRKPAARLDRRAVDPLVDDTQIEHDLALAEVGLMVRVNVA